jgi:hypothetical protein
MSLKFPIIIIIVIIIICTATITNQKCKQEQTKDSKNLTYFVAKRARFSNAYISANRGPIWTIWVSKESSKPVEFIS